MHLPFMRGDQCARLRAGLTSTDCEEAASVLEKCDEAGEQLAELLRNKALDSDTAADQASDLFDSLLTPTKGRWLAKSVAHALCFGACRALNMYVLRVRFHWQTHARNHVAHARAPPHRTRMRLCAQRGVRGATATMLDLATRVRGGCGVKRPRRNKTTVHYTWGRGEDTCAQTLTEPRANSDGNTRAYVGEWV